MVLQLADILPDLEILRILHELIIAPTHQASGTGLEQKSKEQKAGRSAKQRSHFLCAIFCTYENVLQPRMYGHGWMMILGIKLL